MSDIELVVKMPEEAYKLLKDKGVDWLGAEHILNAVANGKQLPKGHGRLFDEQDIVSGNYQIIDNRIYELEPIIDADKEETDRNEHNN